MDKACGSGELMINDRSGGMESYAYSIYFVATMLLKPVTRAYVNGEGELDGPETRENRRSNTKQKNVTTAT